MVYLSGITECDHLRKYSAAILQEMFKSDNPDQEHLVNQFGRTKIFLRQEQVQKALVMVSDFNLTKWQESSIPVVSVTDHFCEIILSFNFVNRY